MDEAVRHEVPKGFGVAGGVAIWVALGVLLFPLSRINYLLFHSLVEIVAVLVAFGIFVIAWNTRRIATNPYLLVLGVPQLFIGAVLLLHALAYRGMGVFGGIGANPATQLWIVARLLAAVAFLCAGVSLRHRLSVSSVIAGFGAVSTAAVASILVWPVFPAMYVEGAGLTPLKVAGEYLVVLIVAGGLALLWQDRDRFAKEVAVLLAAAMLAMIAAELAFTLYVDVYGVLNFAGHYFSLLSLMLVYLAVIDTALVRPYELLFLELKRREEAEREIADTLQSAILAAPERVGSLEMGHAYVSATGLARVGGDFYDLFAPAHGEVAFVVGDVCGKGVEAAASTTTVRTTLRGFAYDDSSPATVLGRSNASIIRQFASDKFATAIYGVLDSAAGHLRIASAGHPDPLLCFNGAAACIQVPRNPPLGVLDEHEFEFAELDLEDGSMLVLFTDGLTEAGWREEQFGAERVVEHAVRNLALQPTELAEGLLSAARSHAGDTLSDDVAVVVLRYTAPVAPGRS
jgi:serine phosphatase RsbU (regulator of sigma subunit)